MRTGILAGALIGITMGAVGVIGLEQATETAQAEATPGPSLAQVKASDLRSQRAIKQGVFAWNLVAKYLAEPGQRIGARQPTNVRQDAGVGGGLPRHTIADGAIDGAKIADGAIGPSDLAAGSVVADAIASRAVERQALSAAVERSLPRWVVKVNNDMGVPVTRQSSPAITMSRLVTGTYLTDFGSDVSGCSWTATPTVHDGVPIAHAAQTMPDPGGNPNRVLTETRNDTGFLVDSGVTVQVVC